MIELPALYSHQEELRDRLRSALAKHTRVILCAQTGCHAKGQGIMLHSGHIRFVEDVRVGDLLMGPDSLPRRVLSLNRGRDEMYRITPTKGSPMVVNLDHVLTLVKTGDHASPGGRIVDVSLREWLTWSARQKHLYKLFRVGVRFPVCDKKSELDPYLLGVVLGDGSLHRGSVCVTTNDPEIVRYLKAVASRHGVQLRSQPAGGSSQTYYLSGLRDGRKSRLDVRTASKSVTTPGDQYGALTVIEEEERERDPAGVSHRRFACQCQCGNLISARLNNLRSGNTRSCGCLHVNPIAAMFRQHGLNERNSGSKFIPHVFKTASRHDRLELLAGLLDTDGHLLSSSSGYDYVSKSQQLSEDVAFVARSVGLAAYVRACEKRCQNGNGGTYWRVGISGDCSIVPCRLAWKSASLRRQKKDALRTGFSVEKVGDGKFYGFTLDGDGRYLLDDFTVTHNCGKTRIAKWILGASANREPNPKQSGRSLFAVQRRGLVQNAIDSFEEEPRLPHGVVMSGVETAYGRRVQVASIDSMLSWFIQDGGYATDTTFDLIVIDETHAHLPKFARFLQYHDAKRESLGLHRAYVIGLSATPQAKGLADVYKELITGPSTEWLIANKFLSPFRYFRATQGKLGLLIKRGNEFTSDSEAAAMDGLAGDLVRDWKKYADGRPTVGFFPRRAHAKDAMQQLEAAGVRVAYVDGDTPDDERRTLFRCLNEHAIDYLANVQVVERGTDIPRIGCVQLCVAVGSVVRYRQMVGRASRMHPEKTDAIVLDHGGNVARHGFFEDDPQWSLDITEREPGEHKSRPTIECPRCSSIYRGGKCRNCGYAPTQRERRSQGLEFDGRELKEVTRKDKPERKVHSAEELMVGALYAAARSGRTWKQCVGIFKRACEKQGTPHRVPRFVEVAGRRYEMIRFGSSDSARKVSALYPGFAGGSHGGEYLVEQSQAEGAPY